MKTYIINRPVGVQGNLILFVDNGTKFILKLAKWLNYFDIFNFSAFVKFKQLKTKKMWDQKQNKIFPIPVYMHI